MFFWKRIADAYFNNEYDLAAARKGTIDDEKYPLLCVYYYFNALRQSLNMMSFRLALQAQIIHEVSKL